MMIKNRTKFVLITGIGLSLFSGLSQAAVDQEDSLTIMSPGVTAPSRLGLGTFTLIYDNKGFSVLNKNEIRRIPKHLVAGDLRGIPQSSLKGFLKNNGHLSVNRGSDGEYSLRVSGGLDGGSWKDYWPFNSKPMGAVAVNLATVKLKEILEPAVATASVGVLANAAATAKLADALKKSNELAAAAGPYAMYVPIICTVGVGLYNGIPRMYNAYQSFHNPTLEAKNENFLQQVNLDFNTCLDEHPLEKGAVGIPSACTGQFNKLKVVTDAMKRREETRPIEEDTTQN